MALIAIILLKQYLNQLRKH